MSDRPDPLAPPEGYGTRPADHVPDLTQCSTVWGGRDHCPRPVAEIWAVGCTEREHAGKVSYCASCAVRVLLGTTTCGQCLEHHGERVLVTVYARTSVDGERLTLPSELAAEATERATTSMFGGNRT